MAHKGRTVKKLAKRKQTHNKDDTPEYNDAPHMTTNTRSPLGVETIKQHEQVGQENDKGAS